MAVHIIQPRIKSELNVPNDSSYTDNKYGELKMITIAFDYWNIVSILK